jgi:hypothetical protein
MIEKCPNAAAMFFQGSIEVDSNPPSHSLARAKLGSCVRLFQAKPTPNDAEPNDVVARESNQKRPTGRHVRYAIGGAGLRKVVDVVV